MSIIVVTQQWPILLRQSHRLIASDPSPVLKATRVFAFVLQALALPPIFGNQVDLVRYEEVRVGVVHGGHCAILLPAGRTRVRLRRE